MKVQDSLIASALKLRVKTITPVERMIVFGSRARGDADLESDLGEGIGVKVMRSC